VDGKKELVPLIRMFQMCIKESVKKQTEKKGVKILATASLKEIKRQD